MDNHSLDGQIVFSVIVAAYNVEKYIKRAIDSIVAQSYTNFEVIIVDDGSTDETMSILKKYFSDLAEIQIVKSTNRGLAAARNLGVKHSKGDFILFLDGDDYYADNDLFFKIANLILITKSDWVSFGSSMVGEQGEIRSIFSGTSLSTMYTAVWNKAYKKELISGLMFPEGKLFEDIDYSLQAWEKASHREHLDTIGHVYWQRSDSIVRKVGDFTKHVDAFEIIQDSIETLQKAGQLHATEKQYLAKQLFAHVVVMSDSAAKSGEHIDRSCLNDVQNTFQQLTWCFSDNWLINLGYGGVSKIVLNMNNTLLSKSIVHIIQVVRFKVRR